ncbi:hypothetical protein CR513_28719, partial [Mucuna pruriens]
FLNARVCCAWRRKVISLSERLEKARCPCPKCHCNKWESRDVVYDHLICKQFPKNYKVWIWHGEAYETMASRNT